MSRIVAEYCPRPVTRRDHDWCAWYEGDESGAVGYGRTREAAVADLVTDHPVIVGEFSEWPFDASHTRDLEGCIS
jgi:hypothetical protein